MKGKKDKAMDAIIREMESFIEESKEYLRKLPTTYKSWDNKHDFSCYVGTERGILKARSLLIIRKLSAWRNGRGL